ncbi:MAG: S8 family peptidase [Thermomicrobiales bacterium]
MRKAIGWAAVLVLVLVSLPAAAPAPPLGRAPVATPLLAAGEWAVLYAADAAPDAARLAIAAAGGTIMRENAAVGLALVHTGLLDRQFLRAVAAQSALVGAAPNLPLGRVAAVEPGTIASVARPLEPGVLPDGNGVRQGGPESGADPLAARQWDMRQIGATADGSYAVQAGDKRVLVGVIDTGVDGQHPDIAPNFDAALSRNFTTTMPDVDGPCTVPSCVAPPDVDPNGHGTHVAGIIAAPLNGLGTAGVAPNVTIVSLRAGQASGLFLLQPVVDALTYAGDIGVNVVNMSFYIDPWLYNCPNNPADSPEAQQEQRTIVAATQRALAYARARGVTLIVAEGNSHSDLDRPTVDTTSPDYPPGKTYQRTVDHTCLIMPTDGEGVINVTATGPSGRKAYYSDYGSTHATLAAPGGDTLDYFGTPQYQPVMNEVLAPYPKAALVKTGEIDAQGNPTALGKNVVRDCRGGVCAYYRYLQGTSMAAPHVTGVVALIVSQYGTPSLRHPGRLELPPARVERILLATTTPQACPAQNPVTYPGVSGQASAFAAHCDGDTNHNSFFGAGLVNARQAVAGPIRPTPAQP